MMSMNKYKTLIKDTSIFAIGSIASKAIVFFLVPLYTNCLSADEYGIADLVFTIAQLVVPFVSLVIFDGVIRFGLERRERPQDALLIGCVVWFIGSAVTIALSIFVNFYTAINEWKVYLALYVIENVLLSIELNYLKVIDKNVIYAISSVVQTAILALMNIVLLVFFEMGVQGYLLANIVSQLVAIILTGFFGNLISELRKAKWDTILAKEMIKYSSPLVLNNLSWWVVQSSDKVMIEKMITASALGVYTVACKIPSLINVFVSVFQQAWGLSSIREVDSSNDNRFYANVLETVYFLTCFGCLGLLIIIKPFMEVYARGDGYEDAWTLVPLLLVSAVFSAVAAYFGSMYGALKKSVNNMNTTLIAAILNIVVNYFAIELLGVIGAVIGTFASYMVLAIIRMVDVNKYIEVPINTSKFVCNAVIIIITAILITCKINIYVNSCMAMIIFLVINRDFINKIIRMKKRGSING